MYNMDLEQVKQQMLLDYKARKDPPWLFDHTIFLTIHGSQAYGLARPDSDFDIAGICVPPKNYFFGFLNSFEQAQSTNPDGAVYGIKKFMQLASDANPNVLEILWIDPKFWIITSTVHEKLLENRELFLSTKAKHTYSGYAMAQLKRIKTHRKWLLHPPDHEPTRTEFGLPEMRKISRDQQGALNQLINDGEVFLPDNAMAYLQKENEYNRTRQEWEQYNNWKIVRNPARAALEAHYGYDCYLEDTEFLTEFGWKHYNEIDNITLLATINKKTGKMEYQYPIDRISKLYTGDIAFIENQHSNCAVSLNHRMLVSPLKRNKTNNFNTVYDSKHSNWYIESLHNLLNKHKSYFHTRITASPPENETNITMFFESDYNGDDLLQLLGCYVSEGCIGKRLKSGEASVLRISQKKEGRIQPIMDKLMLGSLSSKIRRFEVSRPEKGDDYIEIVWTVADKVLANNFEKFCGSGSKNKKLPNWTVFLSNRQARILLESMIAGDGTQRPLSQIYYTSSNKLADDIQALCVSTGIISQKWGPYKYKENECAMYQIYIGQNKETITTIFSKSSNHIIIEPVINTRIVCFTVPNEILITRRNGKIAIHGNTKHAMHLVRLMLQCREILIHNKLTVFREDRDFLLDIRAGVWSYDMLVDWAEDQDKYLDNLAEQSTLPKQPNRIKIDTLCQQIIEEHLYEK